MSFEIPLPTNAQIDSLLKLLGIASAPVTGTKTLVPGVASEVFAGASKKANRVILAITNKSKYSEAFRFRLGESTVSDEKGFVVEAQSTVILQFNPDIETSIYAIPETNALQIEVIEI